MLFGLQSCRAESGESAVECLGIIKQSISELACFADLNAVTDTCEPTRVLPYISDVSGITDSMRIECECGISQLVAGCRQHDQMSCMASLHEVS